MFPSKSTTIDSRRPTHDDLLDCGRFLARLKDAAASSEIGVLRRLASRKATVLWQENQDIFGPWHPTC